MVDNEMLRQNIARSKYWVVDAKTEQYWPIFHVVAEDIDGPSLSLKPRHLFSLIFLFSSNHQHFF